MSFHDFRHYDECSNKNGLDRIYKRTLGFLKRHILSLRDANEILICAKWITRLNQAPDEKKLSRNHLAELLTKQLEDSNLNYPFTYPKNLERSLSSVVIEAQQLSKAEQGTEADDSQVDGELRDIFSNLQQLLTDAETLNLQVEDDLESIRSEALSAKTTKPLEYSLLLGKELKHLLSEEIPKIIRVPDRQVFVEFNEQLQQADCDWIQNSVEGIRRAVVEKIPKVTESVSKAVQTPRKIRRKSMKLEDTLERMFSRFYTDYMLKDHALKIHEKAREGFERIEQSKELEKTCLKRSPRGLININ